MFGMFLRGNTTCTYGYDRIDADECYITLHNKSAEARDTERENATSTMDSLPHVVNFS